MNRKQKIKTIAKKTAIVAKMQHEAEALEKEYKQRIQKSEQQDHQNEVLKAEALVDSIM